MIVVVESSHNAGEICFTAYTMNRPYHGLTLEAVGHTRREALESLWRLLQEDRENIERLLAQTIKQLEKER